DKEGTLLGDSIKTDMDWAKKVPFSKVTPKDWMGQSVLQKHGIHMGLNLILIMDVWIMLIHQLDLELL
ncbi:hypothetical protein J2D73_20460, partial [Acetobacter sacchari]